MASTATRTNSVANKLADSDRAVHDWYRLVLSFPPHLVADYLTRFRIDSGATVLDPFCGTGTTIVESKKNGISSIGLEANSVTRFASQIKSSWAVDHGELTAKSEMIAEKADCALRATGIDDQQDCSYLVGTIRLRGLASEQMQLLLKNSISPMPLHKALVLLDVIDSTNELVGHRRLAFADALVNTVSNLEFGPEVGVGKLKRDVAVIEPWLARVRKIASDIRSVEDRSSIPSRVLESDARNIGSVLDKESVDAVITSPPYPNEKDYTRTTRLESVLLGFIRSKAQLRQLKGGLVRSNTRGIYKGDDDHEWISANQNIRSLAESIESRRIRLGKTSGFERMYPRVVKLYFGGMARHLSSLRSVLRPGAQLAYVVGDQASYLRVMIRTGSLLAEIAEGLGYEVQGLDLFRTRLATATREQLREEVLLLRWNGGR